MLVGLVVALLVFITALAGGGLGAAFGGGFLGSPIPHIQLAAEPVFSIGPWVINNTTIWFWVAGTLLILLVWLGTREMKQVPGRMQGLFEAIVEFFDSTTDSVAGGYRQGRRYLPLVMSIFLILLFSNWLGILPGVGTIGQIETPEKFVEHRLHAAERVVEEEAVARGEHPTEAQLHESALLRVVREQRHEEFVVFEGESGAGFIKLGRGEASKVQLQQIVDADSEDAHEIEEQLHDGRVRELTTDQSEDHPDLLGKRAGILVPFFRGASTDLNTTLAVAIVAMIAVQIWGIRALGAGAYSGKFFVNPLKGGPILTAIGLLEAFGEIARTISFTFRLFGNMFAGEVLLIAMGFLLPLVGMLPFLGLELFVGMIQAFVFAMLTLVFGVTASAGHGEDHADEAHGPAASGAHGPEVHGPEVHGQVAAQPGGH